jgi:hypothetical protein
LCVCFFFLTHCPPWLNFMYQVLPSLKEKHDEFMLRELVRRWLNHKVMVRWLSRFFHYLDRYFIARRSLPALNEVGLACFRDLVCYKSLTIYDIYFGLIPLHVFCFKVTLGVRMHFFFLSNLGLPGSKSECQRCCN